jgi:DNA polymerase-3 subunit epsilon
MVQPPDNYYWERFIDLHGITPELTKDKLTFDHVWNQIVPYVENQNLVAHNGFRFDFPCLEKTLAYYNLRIPNYTGHCTYQIFGTNLASLCKQYKIPLNHHDALSDALACGELFKLYLKRK